MIDIDKDTAEELSQLKPEQVCLLLLRCLNTQDPAGTYLHSLLEASTLKDVLGVCNAILEDTATDERVLEGFDDTFGDEILPIQQEIATKTGEWWKL